MKNRAVLLVEDNQDDIVLMQRALKENKITNKIVVVEDGESAIDILHGDPGEGPISSKSLPAVILLDLKLPKMGGLEVLKHIREDETTKLIPVVILTSSSEEEDLVAGYRLGCNSYIRKPVDFGRFSEVVKRLGMYWLLLNELPFDNGEG